MDTELKRKLAAILVADVVGYSRLMADDEEATLRRLEVFRVIWQDCIGRAGGRIFNTAGDAILAEFQSAVEALRCAMEFQAKAKAHNEAMVPSRQMHFRVGITIGDVVERRGDLLGDGVNIAARLQTLAGSGGICVSSWVREAVSNKIAVQFSDLGDQTVKNIPTPIRAFLARGIGDAGAVTPPTLAKPDLMTRAVSSWKGMAALLGVSALAVAGAFMLLSQMRSSEPVAGSAKPVASKGTPEIRKIPIEAPAATKTPTNITGPMPATAPKAEPAKLETKTAVPAAKSPPTSPVGVPLADPAVRLGVLDATAERGLKAGDRFKECETCPEMVVIPRGEFTMGSSPGQPGHEQDEAPAHKVSIGASIAVGRHAVTVGEFATFVAVTGYRPGPGCRVFEGGQWVERAELSFRNPGFAQNADHPVVCVNWNDATAYTDWILNR